jgi:ABC-type uncharacterized transport system permease subunit
MSNKHKFAEDMTAFGLFIIGIILVVIFMTSCSQTQHGFDYKSHGKSNAQWKHKAEHNKLPKCNRR